MCTSLTTCEWKKVFYEKMEVAKPADSWELIIDPKLKPNELAPGWKQYLEQHASGRFHCSWCWHTWQSAHVVILFHMHLDRAQRAGSPGAREGSGYHFFSLRWCLFWACLCLLIAYLQFSFRSSAFF
ncbi:hypothetical protein HPG69_007138 [Diceros bicornis minor]|uniref:3CxxC-type domain-containing protein n=1 Tax=Diceros bicornis minor TaxID=77932 RepID=A0A7J7F2H3_DICBM|nr:hypothetical protein HPG69_007138 [Diceros bicornis minor]